MVGHGVPYLNRLVGQGVAASANLLPQATVVAVESGVQVRLQNAAVEHERRLVQDVDLKAEVFQVEPRLDGHAVLPCDSELLTSPARDFVVELLAVVLGGADVGLKNERQRAVPATQCRACARTHQSVGSKERANLGLTLRLQIGKLAV